MNYFYKYLIVLLVSGWCYCSVFADDLLKTPGTAAVPLLKIGLSARAAGLSDSFSTIADDISTIYYNPAGLSQIKTTQIYFNHVLWFMDTSIDSVAVGNGTKDGMAGFGFEYRKVNIEDYATNLSGSEIKTGEKINYNISVISLGYSGNTITDPHKNTNFRLGIAAKYINQQIYNTSQEYGIGFDLGLLYGPDASNGYYSVVFQNLGSAFGQEILPTQLSLATGVKENTYNADLEIIQVIDNKSKINLGLEFFMYKIFSLRFGISYQERFSGSFGFGIDAKYLTVDYGYVPHFDLGSTHRFSLLIKL